jgi:hypothetical protein
LYCAFVSVNGHNAKVADITARLENVSTHILSCMRGIVVSRDGVSLRPPLAILLTQGCQEGCAKVWRFQPRRIVR